ncbi:MAG: c-type cytochrome [Pseudomonadota bacterium]
MIRAAFAVFILAVAPVWSETMLLEGHGGPIHDVAISPDGQFALTASFDNSVGLWSLETGEPVWLEGHEAGVKTVVFVGSDLAASAGDDFSIILWDLRDQSVRHRLTGHRGAVNGLAVSSDGQRLISASWDGRLGMWDVTTGEHLGWLDHHTGPVNDVWAGDGRVISGSVDGTVQARLGETTELLHSHGLAVTKVLAAPDGSWTALGGVDGAVLVVADGQVVADLSAGRRPVLALATDAAGKLLAVGDGEGHVTLVDTETWRFVRDMKVSEKGPIWALAFSPDGRRLMMGGINDSAAIWTVGANDPPALANEARAFLTDPATMENGARQFNRKCALCHTLTPDGKRRAGPTLHGLFGREAGTVPGYTYSAALTGTGLIWTAETIDQLFDQGPEHFVPGSKMPMQRITGATDREDLIRYLKENTGG